MLKFYRRSVRFAAEPLQGNSRSRGRGSSRLRLSSLSLLGSLPLMVFLLAISPRVAEAFPEMIRHGYTNCTTCHVSPTGGGLLTDYGRSLSAGMLSTWGSAREAGPLHGLLWHEEEEDVREQVDHWFGIGGDVRAVQVHTENEFEKRGRFIWMQANLDLGYRYRAFTAVTSIGKIERDQSWHPWARSFYGLYQISDEMSVRAGRFLPAFGLAIPDHISPTRGALGFGIYSERDAAEWHWIGEFWNAALGASEGPREGGAVTERSAYGQLQRALGETMKVGASAWYGESDQFNRQVLGAHGALGFTKRLYLLAEVDGQRYKPTNADARLGLFSYFKLGYEAIKGFHVFGLFDHARGDTNDEKTLLRHWGGGLQWYPRPHFEFTGTWTRELKRAASSEEGDYAWLLLHYYL